MSNVYSRESGSLFPDSILDMADFEDINDSVKDIVMQYYQFIKDGNINSAIALKCAHPELKKKWFDASHVNLLKEEVQNIGIYAKLLHGTVVSDTEPTLAYDDYSYWIQPIK